MVESREQRLVETFVEISDTLVDGFDMVELLHRLSERTVELVDADHCGVLIVDATGLLRVAASSDERAERVELLQLQADEGPCWDCYHSGRSVSEPDLGAARERWPRFVTASLENGIHSVLTVPMRLRGKIVGALGAFRDRSGPISEADTVIIQALADMATISLLYDRRTTGNRVLTMQLQTALNSRIVIEQAKGSLAQQTGLNVDEAFALIRKSARRSGQRLVDVARQILDNKADLTELTTQP